MPRFSQYRPDFMAPGPNTAVEKDKPISLTDPEENNDDEEEMPSHRFYESQKILGKLFRAIDEHQVLAMVQQHGKARRRHSPVIKAIWKYVQDVCQNLEWAHHLANARMIRDE